jgi:hypothetical protein
MQRVFTVNPLFDPPSSAASASSVNRFNLNLAKCPNFSRVNRFFRVNKMRVSENLPLWLAAPGNPVNPVNPVNRLPYRLGVML